MIHVAAETVQIMDRALCSSGGLLRAASFPPTRTHLVRHHHHQIHHQPAQLSVVNSEKFIFRSASRETSLQRFTTTQHSKIPRIDGKRKISRDTTAQASTSTTIQTIRDAVPPSLLFAMLPVALAMAVSKQLNLGLQGEITTAAVRATAQLTVLGFALKLVFERQNIYGTVAAMMVMVAVAGQTSGERAKALPRSRIVTTAALIGGTFSMIWLMVFLGVFPVEPRFLIPATGYLLGNSMTVVATALKTVANDVRVHEAAIEARLALGATARQAVEEHLRHSLVLALGPIFDHMKVSGLVTLPGAMTGMLMSGAPPMEAVASSLVLLYMLVGASSLTAVLGAQLGWRALFTSSMQVVGGAW